MGKEMWELTKKRLIFKMILVIVVGEGKQNPKAFQSCLEHKSLLMMSRQNTPAGSLNVIDAGIPDSVEGREGALYVHLGVL